MKANEEIEMAAKKIPSDTEKLAIARKGLAAVRALINESQGVAGLHLNGDLAPWSELEQGGQFEAWLVDFNEAEDVLKD